MIYNFFFVLVTAVYNNFLFNRQLVDDAFFSRFVGPYDSKHVAHAYEKFYEMIRIRDFKEYTLEMNKKLYEGRIKRIVENSRDYNIDLVQTKLKRYYTLL